MISSVVAQRTAAAVGDVIRGYSAPDVCERVLLYLHRERGFDWLSNISSKLREKEEDVATAMAYLTANGFITCSNDLPRSPEFTNYGIEKDAKEPVKVYFEERFKDRGDMLIDAETGPMQAASIIDSIRSLPESELSYRKRCSLKMAELKELREDAQTRLEAIRASERLWFALKFGSKYIVTGSSLTHAATIDPYRNDHAGRPNDADDVFFDLSLDLSGKSSAEIIAAKVSRVNAKIPPYHSLDIMDAENRYSLPRGESYEIKLRNPFSSIAMWFEPEQARAAIEARSSELKLLIEEQLEG
ncbi:MAG: hypothetical protein HY518_03175 [Candidatus Aenigmarchaeota archaeon]|nr:hypothetical protein [Candidatus Aenigmarchaeota archaeon]